MKPLLCSLGAARKREMISNSLNLLLLAAVQQEKKKEEKVKTKGNKEEQI